MLAELEVLDQCDDDDSLQEDARVKRVDLLSQLRNMEEKEVFMLKQKARVYWLKSGDINSRFYHSRLRWRRNKNDLVGLSIDGVWCEEVSIVKCKVKRYFESRFGVRSRSKINLDGVNFKNILEIDNDLLCKKITELEVLEVVDQCGSSKSSGPDGFNFFFIKKN